MGCGCSADLSAFKRKDVLTTPQMDALLKRFDSPVKYQDQLDAFHEISNLECMFSRKDPAFQILLCTISGSVTELSELLDNFLEKQENFNHPNLLMIHGISVDQVTHLLYPATQIRMLIDAPMRTLAQHTKLLNKKPFSEEEIWFLLDCLSGVLAYKQGIKFRSSYFSKDDIYEVRTPFGLTIFKLSDRFWKPSPENPFANLVNKQADSDAFKEAKRTVILSPQQIASVPLGNKYPAVDLYRAQVFQFGLIILHCLDHQPTKTIYDWHRWEVNVKKLWDRLCDIYEKKLMSGVLTNILTGMLKIDEQERLDCIQLSEQISGLYKEAGKKRLLDLYDPATFSIRYQSDEDFEMEEYSSPHFEGVLFDTANNQLGVPRLETLEVIQDTEHHNDAFQTEQIKSHQLSVPQEQAQAQSKASKLSDTYKLTNSEVTPFNLGISKSQGFILSPQGFGYSNGNSPAVSQKNFGRIAYSNGCVYEGQVQFNKRVGKGVLFDEQGRKLVEGGWLADNPHGEVVIYQHPHQEERIVHNHINQHQWCEYRGYAQEGVKQGKGSLWFANGDTFEGQFQEDQANGMGVYTYKNGIRVEGVWVEDEFQE